MVVRVVVGGCPLGRRLARELDTWPGDLYVLVGDDTAAERLREDGIAATTVDLESPASIRSAVDDPTVVFVTSQQPSDDRGRLEAAHQGVPTAWLTAVTDNRWPAAEAIADQVVEIDRVYAADLADQLLDDDFARTGRLLRTLAGVAGPIAVVMHDNPDPDAIAAALGIVRLAEVVGHEATPLYAGEITHQENRAFVNLLELELEAYEAPFDTEAYGSIALVDHAHPGVNDQLPPSATVDIVIDHHPAREEADAAFVDRRHRVGATSTLVADHLLRARIGIDTVLATALWYGILVDTDGFSRGVSKQDFETAARLRDAVDTDVLDRIESPQMTARTLDTIGAAIDHRTVVDDVLIAGIGEAHDRDALAQAADELLRMDDIGSVLIYGRKDDTIYASARSRSDRVDVGDAIRLAFGQIGDAGGHEDMAGAQIPVGVLAPDGDDDVDLAIADVLADRFVEGVTMASRPLPSGHLHDELAME